MGGRPVVMVQVVVVVLRPRGRRPGRPRRGRVLGPRDGARVRLAVARALPQEGHVVGGGRLEAVPHGRRQRGPERAQQGGNRGAGGNGGMEGAPEKRTMEEEVPGEKAFTSLDFLLVVRRPWQ